uniref:C2H2-type domain-containing protein n=1 Tax=Kalanchoe fedtschenkoi TaxID=63787 RepID=A0A7N0RGF0_KALFE
MLHQIKSTVPSREPDAGFSRVVWLTVIAQSMEFWGVEVKVGKPKLVQPGEDNVIHLSQACLAEVKKGNEKEPVHLYVNTANQKLCIGTLSSEKFPQIAFDLVFDKNFKVSHTSKSGSVHLSGYKTSLSEFNSEDTAKASLNEAKIGNAVTTEHKNKEVLEPSGEVNHDSESDSSDAFDSSDDEDTPNAKKVSIEEAESDDDEDGSDSDDEDDSDDSDEDESDKEAQIKVPVPAKKAKLVTPQKTVSGKSSRGHVATPYPTKIVAKTSGNSDKSKPQSHEYRCNPCNRTFGSENALQSHSKAKHGLK